MSPADALRMLDNVAATAPVNRQTQAMLIEAVKCLDAYIKEKGGEASVSQSN